MTPPPPGRSGRRVVAAFVAAVLVMWFGVDRAFRGWAARHEARARFGAEAVAPAVDPLADLTPPGVPPGAWRAAVADTHAILVALTGAGLLDEPQMDDLRRRLDAQVREVAVRPEAARAALSRIWDDLERDAGPAIAPDVVPPPPNSRHAGRHPRPRRPALLGPSRPVKIR